MIRDGKIGVLISPDFGSGIEDIDRFNDKLIQSVEAKESLERIHILANHLFPGAYLGGLQGIEVIWVKIGRSFFVHEYDGSESIWFMDEIKWLNSKPEELKND